MPKDSQRAWVRLPWPSVRMSSIRLPCQARISAATVVGEAGGGSGEVVGAQQLPAGRVRAPALVRVLGGVGGFIDDDGLQPGFDRRLHPDRRGGLAAEERAHPVPEPADVLLQAPEELAGARRSPASGPGLRRAAGRRPWWRPGSGPRRPGRRRGHPSPRTSAARCCAWAASATASTRPPSALTVPLSVRRAISARPCGVRGEVPAARPAAAPRRRPAACPARPGRLPARRTAAASPRPSRASIARRSALTSASAAGGHPVQHHGHHDVPGRRVQQQLPGDGVGVAVGGGDEDPEVGGGEQLAGELAVVIGDGVDVGGIQQRDPLRDRRVGHQHQRGDRRRRPARARPGWPGHGSADHGAPDPAEARQDALVLEPGGVRGMVQQDRLPRGGPDGPGPGDGVAHQRVDERGFAGAGGTADDGEQRGVEAAVARAGCSHRAGPRRCGSPAAPALRRAGPAATTRKPGRRGRLRAAPRRRPTAAAGGLGRRLGGSGSSDGVTASSCQFGDPSRRVLGPAPAPGRTLKRQ